MLTQKPLHKPSVAALFVIRIGNDPSVLQVVMDKQLWYTHTVKYTQQKR
jgi:hypothetical protein